MLKLKTIPIRAAKSFGPAFIMIGFNPNSFTVRAEIMAKGLYFDNSNPRNMKSINNNIINIGFGVSKKAVIIKTVRNALALATFSLILLFEIGHIAVDFIGVISNYVQHKDTTAIMHLQSP